MKLFGATCILQLCLLSMLASSCLGQGKEHRGGGDGGIVLSEPPSDGDRATPEPPSDGDRATPEPPSDGDRATPELPLEEDRPAPEASLGEDGDTAGIEADLELQLRDALEQDLPASPPQYPGLAVRQYPGYPVSQYQGYPVPQYPGYQLPVYPAYQAPWYWRPSQVGHQANGYTYQRHQTGGYQRHQTGGYQRHQAGGYAYQLVPVLTPLYDVTIHTVGAPQRPE